MHNIMMKHPLHHHHLLTTISFLLILLLINPVNSEWEWASDWEYIPPLYACSPTISNCSPNTNECLANPNHPQSTTDAECAACHSDQKYWPCDVDGLCYCWDKTTSQIPPAPSTRHYDSGKGLNISKVDPCDIITETVFKTMAPQAFPPYSYSGFCAAVRKYNKNHPTEGVFNMGNIDQQKSELASYFGNALHESDEFRAGREYLMCADRIELGGEVYCRPCDVSSFDWDLMKCPVGASLASGGRAFNSYCSSNLAPPEGCECDDVYERSESGPMAGYVKANQVYFGRGSIQLSWNYNYIRASVALTGAPQTFCQRPDLVATNEEYAWGAGLFYWMENIKNDKTCHQSVLLDEDFGLTLDNINGGLECPADDYGWHGKAVQLRLNRYCRAASAIGVKDLLSLDGCMGMDMRMRQCLDEGTCKDCKAWEGKLKLPDEVVVTVSEAAADDGSNGGNGNKKKDKEKNKQNGNAANDVPISKKKKEKEEKEKNKQQAAAAAAAAAANGNTDNDKDELQSPAANNNTVKDKDAQQAAKQDAAATVAAESSSSTLVTMEETPKPTPLPTTSQPTARPTARPTAPTPATHSTIAEDPFTGPCTGDPCPLPPGITAEFCRNSDGFCGTGTQYCNAYSTWTDYCHDCDSIDSKYGCPTFGCNECYGESQLCVGNLNGVLVISDEDCEPCGFGMGGLGQEDWPCDEVGSGGCWCWDTNLPRVEPSPPSWFDLDTTFTSLEGGSGEGVCNDLLDRSTFQALAPSAVAPFTYRGFCDAIDHYNSHHAEKVFRMGSRQQRSAELAAFLGMASHETRGFINPREYLECGDNIEVDGELYCKPCSDDNYDYSTLTCAVSMLANDQSYMHFCQPETEPPNGCSCEYVNQVEASGPLEGRMKANDIFFGRGSIQLSHNINYIRASASMTGSEETFCAQPELMAMVESYSWGVGLYIWMQYLKEEGKTCHTHALNGDFGAALDIISGGLECPVGEDEVWYAEAVKSRLDHYCHAAKVVGVTDLLGLGGCEGLGDVFLSCIADLSCPRCAYWDPTDLPTIAPVTPSPTKEPTRSPILVAIAANKNDAVTASTASAEMLDENLITQHPTRFPTESPTNSPAILPTPAPIPNPTPIPTSTSAANQFAILPQTPPIKPTASKNEPAVSPSAASQFGVPKPAVSQPKTNPPPTKPAVGQPASPPSQPSQHSNANQFAMTTHSKGRDNPGSVQQSTVIRPDTASSITQSPTKWPTKSPEENTVSYALQFGGTSNWDNTNLKHPPSTSMTDAHTPLLTEKPVNVLNIGQEFYQSSNVDEAEEIVADSAGLGNNRPSQPASSQGISLDSVGSPGGDAPPQSYFTKLDDNSYEFTPMDDVTISRSFPSSNFGSEPAVVVDMLEGDAALFRFDLSAVGDGTIKKATLRLTTNEDDGVIHAGVYYIQPAVNGWTEDGITYDTAPKADGPLFASVASHSKDDNSFELDVTKAVANHVVSFRVIGTDRVRREFSSKESSQVNNAPVLLAKLESSKLVVAAEDTSVESMTGTTLHSKQGSSDKDESKVVNKNGSEESSPSGSISGNTQGSSDNNELTVANTNEPEESSTSGSISGHVWLDRNADGIQDVTEAGLRGMLVDLYKCNNDQWTEGMRTAAGGDYLFNELEEGRYYVVVNPGADLGFSKQDAGMDDSKGSDVDSLTGRSNCIELSSSSPGQLSATVNAGIVQPTRNVPSSTTAVEVSTTPESPDVVSESEKQNVSSPSYNSCRGMPCTDGEGYCRSRYNFCGTGDEYCNEDSRWVPECGTPSPTSQPSAPPTTSEPTFIHDPNVHCSGEPCDEGDETWCRSEIGYCGAGPLYCNADSTWMPDCDTVNGSAPTQVPSIPVTDAPIAPASDAPTLEQVPTGTPTLSSIKDAVGGLSPFALPTLSQIVAPKQTDISALTKEHSNIATIDEDEKASSVQSDVSAPAIETTLSETKSQSQPTNEQMMNNNNEETPWYVRFADVKPIERNPGSRSIPGIVCVLSAILVLEFV